MSLTDEEKRELVAMLKDLRQELDCVLAHKLGKILDKFVGSIMPPDDGIVGKSQR